MLVAVTAQGRELASPVHDRFGRCPFFVLVDPTSMKVEAIPNPNASSPSGAGTRAAQLLGERNVDAVLVDNIGPHPATALKAAGIRVYAGIKGTVADAVYDFAAGRLRLTTEATGPARGEVTTERR